MSDRTALVTGATDGVGRLVALQLAQLGWKVLAHGRDRERGRAVVDEIEQAGGSAHFYRADFASIRDVADLVEAVLKDSPKISLLINNAGVGFGPPMGTRETSFDGLELRFAVNYLAPFILSRRLLENLRDSAPARIVNIASIGQADLDFSDLQLTRNYTGVEAYRRSKLALIMLTLDLAEELEGSGVTANAVHPATFMDTAMVRETGSVPMSSVHDGARAILKLAAGHEMARHNGRFFNRFDEVVARAQAYDKDAREKLRRASFQLMSAMN